jgi:uncharacterized protein
MNIDVNRIPQQGLFLQESIDAAKLNLDTALLKFHRPIKVEARVSRITNSVTVELVLSTLIHATCSRCLDEFVIDFKKEPRLNYIANKSQALIDLNPAIAEEIVLDFPLKPLCKLDCKGLCPKCGRDLNREKCNCVR